jgi:cobalt-precorrin 5A hydrolase
VSARIAIGVGCRSGCSADAIEALVRQALIRRTVAGQALGSPAQDEHARDQHARDQHAQDQHAQDQHAQDQHAQDQRNQDWPPVTKRLGLFTIRDKDKELGLVEAAGRLGLSLIFLPREALREQAPFIRTRSAAAESRFGVPSVAEAAALAGAGPNAVLIVARIAGNGATCAIAITRDDPS